MKNILVVGYPRSGNTFLGYLLSYHFNAPYYDMYDLAKALAGEGNLAGLTLAPEAFSGTLTRADQEKQVGAVLKSHELPENLHPKHRAALDHVAYQKSDPLILITREPKDVAVSYFYYIFFRQTSRRGHWSRRLPDPIRNWYYLTCRFEDFSLKVARNWSLMVNEWCQLKPLVIRYEDLRKNPEVQIQRVAGTFGLQFHAEYAKEAIEFCKFSHLVELERARNPSVRENERSHRIGETGGWKGFFSSRLQSKFDAATQEAAGLVGYR